MTKALEMISHTRSLEVGSCWGGGGGHHLKHVRVLNLNLWDPHTDFRGCVMVAVALSISFQRQEERSSGRDAKRKNCSFYQGGGLFPSMPG